MNAPAATTAAPPGAPGAPGAAAGGEFGLYVVFWFLLFLAVGVAWGQSNAWPDELLTSVLFLPLHIAAAVWLFQRGPLTVEIAREQSQEELFMAYLLLAVGLASGLQLLITIGLLAVGTAWLAPTGRGVDWLEWLKLPALFALSLPLWLDVAGSRHEWFARFADPVVNPVYRLPLEVTLTRVQALVHVLLVLLVVAVPGRGFWWSLLVIPLLIGLSVVLSATLAWRPELSPGARDAVVWVLIGLLLVPAVAAARGLARRAGRAPARDGAVSRWMENRSYPPWLAATVVVAQQAVPLESLPDGPAVGLALVGAALLLTALYVLRRRSPDGPVHARSQVMVAGALAVLLGAEFVGSDYLRHVALGLTLIGLTSWHRLWPWSALVAGSVAWALLVPPTDLPLLRLRSEPAALLVARFVLVGLSLALLAAQSRHPMPAAETARDDNVSWQPVKRFGLILLGLILLFQNASAFWPEPSAAQRGTIKAGIAGGAPSLDPLSPGSDPETQEWLPSLAGGSVQVTITLPWGSPVKLEAPELAFKARGWKVLSRRVVPHPFGNAVALELARDREHAAALYWFEMGGRTFGNYLYARRILWSGWFLAQRDLRLVMLSSTQATNEVPLLHFAQEHDWFRNEEGPAGAVRPE